MTDQISQKGLLQMDLAVILNAVALGVSLLAIKPFTQLGWGRPKIEFGSEKRGFVAVLH